MLITLLIMFICICLTIFSTLSNKMNKFKEKTYSFECGFNPKTTPRSPFSLQFFKTIMLFLLFDIEIILILPYPLIQMLNYTLKWKIFILTILLIGLYYEWKEGALKWIY